MRIAILSFVAGAAWLQCQAALPPWRVLVLGAALLLACLVFRQARGRIPLLAAGGALLGVGWAALLAHGALADQLAPVDEGRDVSVVGIIDHLPYRFDGGVRFNFAVEQVVGSATKLPRRIALSWYPGVGQRRAAASDVRPGQRWQFSVRLQRPHGNANPHGFDYEAWLLEQGVRATGHVRPGPNALLAQWVPGPRHTIERARDALRAHILSVLERAPYRGVIVALVVGDQRGIAQSDWEVFNRSGISHLVSIVWS